MNKKKTILLLIVFLVIGIIIISVLLILLKSPSSLEEIQQDVLVNEKSLDDTVEVKDYFIIKNAIEKFYSNCAKLDADENDIVQYATKLSKQEWNKNKDALIEEEQKQAADVILAILDSSYINEFDINKQNIKEKFNLRNDVKVFLEKVTKISMSNSEDVISYLTSGYYVDIEESKSINFELVVNLNTLNNAYSILTEEYLKKHEYTNINKNLSFKIDNNGYNVFEDKEIEDKDIATEFFYNYKYNMLYNNEKAYSMLETSYKDKRFENLQNYKEYINDNYNNLENSVLTKYQIEENENGKKYICLDNFENYYIFNVKNIMDYDLMLDTYTIESEKFRTEYNNGSNQKKVQLNIDKFIKMINNKDYSYAYDVLDENFKNNYFKTEENFEKYIKNNFLEFSNINFEKFTQEGEIFIYQIVLSDKTSKSDKKLRMNVIMKLEEGTGFIMSFGATN